MALFSFKKFIREEKISRFLAQALVVFFFIGISSLYAAFEGPTASPPNGNVAPPVNTSAVFQQKLGAFWASSIGTDAGYCIGNSCITSWSQAGKVSCPDGFTRVAKNGRTLGCIQSITQRSTYDAALMSCWNGFGARLPSYAEFSITKQTLNLKLSDDFWLENGSVRPAGETAPFRCFIPAGA